MGVFVTENIPLTTSTVLVDSVPTSGSNYLLAGQYQHPGLGTITAKSFFQPIYSTAEAPAFEAGATVDSLVLVLAYDYAIGNTAVDQQVSVHLLTDSIQRRPYFRSESLPYNPAVAGSTTFKLLLDSSAARRTARVRLPQSLGERLLSYSGQSFADFVKNFYGFALVGAETGNGAIVSYRSSNTLLVLYYSAGGTAKSYTYGAYANPIFPTPSVPNPQSRYTAAATYLFNQITADGTNPVAGRLTNQYDSVPSTPDNPETYVQGGLGIMTRIRFDNFDEIRRQGNVAINRAELVVTPSPGSAPSAVKLMLYDATGAGKILRNPDVYWPLFIRGDLISSVPLATYADGKYTFNITTYIQELLLNKYSNDGLFLSLPSVVTDLQLRRDEFLNVTPDISLEESVRGATLGGHNHPTAPIKLKIYYTPIRAN
ncbi:MAG: DUF4270 family protein [Cytophagales bacterium]|nr:DUF4270 family protein [Cytophagales bacterium]